MDISQFRGRALNLWTIRPTAPVLPAACRGRTALHRNRRSVEIIPMAVAGNATGRQMPRLIIANIDYLVTVDPSRRIIRDGALVIQDGRTVAVGKTAEFPLQPSDDVIDGRGKLALPGVFDTHVHNAQQLGRSCGDEAWPGAGAAVPPPVAGRGVHGQRRCARQRPAGPGRDDPCRHHLLCRSGSYFSAETAQAVESAACGE